MAHHDAFPQPQATVLSTVTDPSKCLAGSEPLQLFPGSHFHLGRLLIQSASNPSDQLSRINGNRGTRHVLLYWEQARSKTTPQLWIIL